MIITQATCYGYDLHFVSLLCSMAAAVQFNTYTVPLF